MTSNIAIFKNGKIIFLYILNLLKPLKEITKELTNFANGKFSSRININSKDEIGILANSFNIMASSLENSIKTREELLRDIGHELRTPIAKGKFAIEKIEVARFGLEGGGFLNRHLGIHFAIHFSSFRGVDPGASCCFHGRSRHHLMFLRIL